MSGGSHHFHIRVENLDPDTSPAELRSLFAPLGSVKSRMQRRDGFAVVTFLSEDKAKNAISKTSGTQFRGRSLRVMWASANDTAFAERDRSDAPAGRGRGRGGTPGGYNDRDSFSFSSSQSSQPDPRNRDPLFNSSNTQPPRQAAVPAPVVQPQSQAKPLWMYNLGPIQIEAVPDVMTQPFFIIDCEGALEDGVSILPTEIAIMKFSLKEGETAKFHYFIDPGHLPICHIGETIWRGQHVTGIPHDRKFELAEKNYSKIWTELCDFVGFPAPDKWTQDMIMKRNLPTFYAKQPGLKSRCLEWLADKSGFPQFFGDVKSIEELIWLLRWRKGSTIQTSHVQDFFQKMAQQYFQFKELMVTPNMDSRSLVPLQKLFAESRCDYHKRLLHNDPRTAEVSCALSGARTISFVVRKIYDEETS